jgi:transposase
VIDAKLIEVLFPRLAGVVVEDVICDADVLQIRARTRTSMAECPGCGTPSVTGHGRYERRLADAAVGGRRVMLRLSVRRFVCRVAECPRWTFVEQVPGLTFRFGRVSTLLRGVLETIARALAGRPGARLARRTWISVSRSTLLRLLRAIPQNEVGAAPRVLGIDDFALRRGHVYATILINMETGRPVDVLPDRTAATLARWLREHPGAQIVCRDRASAYAEAVRTAAPQARQVADRWHVWANLTEAVEKCVLAHRGCLIPPVHTPASAPPLAPASSVEGRLSTRTRERHRVIHNLSDKGVGVGVIAAHLGLDRKTVRRFVNAATAEDLIRPKGRRNGALRPHLAYLHQRWNEGCTDAVRLHAEIRERGYTGSQRTVRRWLQPLRASELPAPVVSEPPTVRQVTRWLTCRPEKRSAQDAQRLTELLTRCPDLNATADHITTFATLLTGRRGKDLPEWIRAVDASGPPQLRAFALNLNKDLEAVIAGLTLQWNSGMVEGHVNRIKALKRAMFGRARLDLLRRRILLPN